MITDISYHCSKYSDIVKILDFFKNKNYTFNGNKIIKPGFLGDSNNDGEINTIIHVNHKHKDLGYDYYFINETNKYKFITKNKNIVDCQILFREEKLKRILNGKT
jgi:hypothetical protein